MRFPAWIFLTSVLFVSASLESQTFERVISDVLDERPNGLDHTNDGGYIIAGTQKDLPMG